MCRLNMKLCCSSAYEEMEFDNRTLDDGESDDLFYGTVQIFNYIRLYVHYV